MVKKKQENEKQNEYHII